MWFRFAHLSTFLAVILLIPILFTGKASADVASLELIDAYATLPGETAQIGFFEENQQIDLYFIFDLETDSTETGRFTWDVYNRYGRVAYTAERELTCVDGRNNVTIPDAIPVDLSTGTQVYSVYASVSVDGHKEDTGFEIRVESPQAYPGVLIEDVRLEPREDNSFIADEIGDAAIPYTLEIDFRAENIISWAHAEIRWLGVTVEGFILDQGLGTTDVYEGFNTFDVDTYLARPPYGATPQADYSVEVVVYGHFDSVTFPLESLPVSLMALRSARGVEDESAFSIGEGYFVTEDGIRASYFGPNETITARLLTGGRIPENTRLLMLLTGGPDEISQEFTHTPEPGAEIPAVDYIFPDELDLEYGLYEFSWAVLVGNVFFAERVANLTVSGREHIQVPAVVDLPGDATFTAPINWTVNLESGVGQYATIINPDGVVCRILGQELEDPLNVELLADIFESDIQTSGIPSDATSLTIQEAAYEGSWESTRRAYLGDGKVFVHDYWLWWSGDYEYHFLITTSVGNEDQVSETYAASDAIRNGIDLGI